MTLDTDFVEAAMKMEAERLEREAALWMAIGYGIEELQMIDCASKGRLVVPKWIIDGIETRGVTYALTEKHGTPTEFENAVWNACANLFITYDEAIAAIQKYRIVGLTTPTIKEQNP